PASVGSDIRHSACVRPQEQRSEGPLVLVVEDDNTSRELLSHYLVASGYSVCHAGSAVEAFETALRLRPAAITLDMLLPDENGLHLLARLRANPITKEIPVVVVSILDDRESGLQAGAAAWLVKPVQRQQFIDALDLLVPMGDRRHRVALVVDDDREAVELATDVLRGRGFEVLQALGGREGMSLAIRHSPALIILDLNMPGVSGFTVAQQLRAHPRTRQTPILVSTAMDLTGQQRDELMRDVQTIVAKGGTEAILEALERLGLIPGRPGSDEIPASGISAHD
ncbi:MAG: response regulator, partial [Acidimicrobiia bacterium]